jgi:hypothetical protein
MNSRGKVNHRLYFSESGSQSRTVVEIANRDPFYVGVTGFGWATRQCDDRFSPLRKEIHDVRADEA